MPEHKHVLLLLSIILSLTIAEENDTVKMAETFLNRFGYVDNNSITDLSTALIQFQERYNLPVSGELDETTVRLMKSPRCSQGDNAFMIHSKWNKTDLRWYFPQAEQVHLSIAKKAFDMWEKVSKLKFERVLIPSKQKPDITITFGQKRHNFRANCQGTAQCPHDFDGEGSVLAHAFFPDDDKQCVEIHFDLNEKWYFGDGIPSEGQVSFLMVLVHELGHALGLGHSSVNTAVMYSWYKSFSTEFDDDDKNAIEYLYGKKDERKFAKIPKSTTMPTTTTLRTESTRTTTTTPRTESTRTTTTKARRNKQRTSKSPKLCEIQAPTFMFLAIASQFPNYWLYIVYEEFLWKLDLNDIHIPEQPVLLSDNLPSELKDSLSQVSHAFQNSKGDLVTIIDKTCYAAKFPILKISHRINFSLPAQAQINAVFQTNSGQSYLLYNSDSYIEFDENGDTLNRGPLNYAFPGVPTNIISALRYVDGYIYFFTRNTYYKYSEYTRKVVDAGDFSWNIFGVPCPNVDLLSQLKTLLSKVVSIYE